MGNLEVGNLEGIRWAYSIFPESFSYFFAALTDSSAETAHLLNDQLKIGFVWNRLSLPLRPLWPGCSSRGWRRCTCWWRWGSWWRGTWAGRRSPPSCSRNCLGSQFLDLLKLNLELDHHKLMHWEISLHPITRYLLIFIYFVSGRRMGGINGQNLLLGFRPLSKVPRRTIHRKGCIIRPRAVTHGKRLAGLGEGQLGGGSRREPEGWHRPVSRDIVPWHARTRVEYSE